MDSILFIVKKKKESIGLFIYLCWHRMERWIVFYSL